MRRIIPIFTKSDCPTDPDLQITMRTAKLFVGALATATALQLDVPARASRVRCFFSLVARRRSQTHAGGGAERVG